VFFIFGAIVASIAYSAGKINNSEAQSRQVVETLTVKDILYIGDVKKSFITLTAVDNSATIALYSRSKFVAGLSVTNNEAELYLTDNMNRQENIAQIKTGKTKSGKKLSLIRLKDIQGENLILTDWGIE
jgi:hypothetical protein